MNRPLLPIAILLLAGIASAQPAAIEARSAEIRELARRAADARIPDAERLRALDDALAQRRALIESLAGEAPASLLLEQVEALLFRFTWDGSDAAAMFGVLLANQREAAGPIAREAHALSLRADARLEAEIAAAERAGDNPAQEALQRLRELPAPLVRARSAIILASLEPDAKARNDLAVAAAAAASGVRPSQDNLEAQRRVILGQSALILAQADVALAEFDAALTKRSAMSTRMEAQLGRALALLGAKKTAAARASLREATTSPPFVVDGRSMVVPTLLATDVEARIAIAEAQAAPAGPARDLAYTQAFGLYERLLPREDFGLEPSQRRSLVLGKINEIAPQSVEDCLALPPVVALARGFALSTAPGGFEGAVTLLKSVTEPGSARLRALGDLAALALRTLGDLGVSEAKAYEDDERLIPAIRLFQRAGREFPNAEELALPSVISAIFYTSRWAASRPDIAIPRDLLEESLRIGITSFPDSRPARSWREKLAHILLEQGKVDEALAQLDVASDGAPLSVEGHVTLLRSLSAAMDASIEPDARTLLAQRILERADAALRAADALPSAASDADLRAADTLRVLAYAASASSQVALDRPEHAKSAALRAVEFSESLRSRDTFRAALVALVNAQAYAGDFADALATTDRLSKGAKEYAPDACAIIINLATIQAKALDAALRPDDAKAIAQAALVPAARLALEATLEKQPEAADRWRADLGEALARAGQAAEAADILKDLITRNGPDTRTLVWLGEAALTLNDDANAYDAFLQVVTALEQREAPTEQYWHAWSRALEIFMRNNDDGSKTEQVRATLLRLRTNDPTMGGEPYASRFAAIDKAVNKP